MTDARHPPPPQLSLTVGITGHRPPIFTENGSSPERETISFVLTEMAAAARALGARHGDLFDHTPFTPRLVSPLAEGADQITAQVALDCGYRLQAILPLPQLDYAADFSRAGRTAYEALLAKAETVLELPVQPTGRAAGYGLAGRATIAQSDILIALWDGEPARGSGGTAEIVELALRQGIPVVHLPVIGGEPGRILWSGYGEFVDPSDLTVMPERLVSQAELHTLVSAILGPPSDPSALADLRTFLDEPQRRVRLRIEYPLMLTLLGVKMARLPALIAPLYPAAVASDWRRYHEACVAGRGIAIDLGSLEASFSWADSLAQHFAQTYRSGHVLNFVLAAVAVLLALTGLLLPSVHFWLAIGEPVAIGLLVANTLIGTRRQWHRRWLEYRQLAERLRPMRTLKLLGICQPAGLAASDPQDGPTWIDWYARAAWRRLPTPCGLIADPDATIQAIAASEIRDQVAYHRASARQMHRLDRRLHRLGMVLFCLTILACALLIAANIILAHAAEPLHEIFVALSAGLPALGAAIFGIRMQGDFGATAERSQITADVLERIADALCKPGLGLSRQGDLLEAAASAMRSELGEWRRAYAKRTLELP